MSEETSPYPNGRTVACQEGLWRLSVAHFLTALILQLVTLPFVLETAHGKLIEAALFTLVLLSAVLAVGGRRRTLFVGAVLVTPAVVGQWLTHFQPDLWPNDLTLTAGAVFIAFTIVHMLRFILQAQQVDSQVLCAGISTYLMLGILWAFAYAIVANQVPQAFVCNVGPERDQPLAAFNALYFSFCTLTTVGYGDIVPLTPVARQLAMLEATTGTFYVTVLIARLVSLYSAAEPHGLAPTTLNHRALTNSKEDPT